MKVEMKIGDCLDVLKQYADESFDACVTDPPYDLVATSRGGSQRVPGTGPFGRHREGTKAGGGFMGREWDATGISFRPETWSSMLRVLKPGAHLLAFGGDRTYHRLTCAIEDAGFEIRRTIFWIYGQGFPKSEDVGRGVEMQMCKLQGRHFDKTLPKDDKARAGDHICPPAPNDWIGWGTDLKPACEPIVVARKPLSGSVAKNVLKYGTGGINVDAGRVETHEELSQGSRSPGSDFSDDAYVWPGEPGVQNPAGRWPANVILTHDPNCTLRGMKRVKANGHFAENTGESALFGGDQGGFHGVERDERQIREEIVEDWDCVQECPVRLLDEQSGELQSGKGPLRRGSTTGNSIGYGGQPRTFDGSAAVVGDSGGASRFFYVAKATREEREFGLGRLPARSFGQSGGAQSAIEEGRGEYIQQGNIGLNRVKKVRNFHPTVKPVELMRYLVKLVTPPGGLVLDPFAGSGTTLIAAKLEGFRALGIEKEPEYEAIIRARMKAWAPLENFGDE